MTTRTNTTISLSSLERHLQNKITYSRTARRVKKFTVQRTTPKKRHRWQKLEIDITFFQTLTNKILSVKEVKKRGVLIFFNTIITLGELLQYDGFNNGNLRKSFTVILHNQHWSQFLSLLMSNRTFEQRPLDTVVFNLFCLAASLVSYNKIWRHPQMLKQI